MAADVKKVEAWHSRNSTKLPAPRLSLRNTSVLWPQRVAIASTIATTSHYGAPVMAHPAFATYQKALKMGLRKRRLSQTIIQIGERTAVAGIRLMLTVIATTIIATSGNQCGGLNSGIVHTKMLVMTNMAAVQVNIKIPYPIHFHMRRKRLEDGDEEISAEANYQEKCVINL